MTKYCSRKTDVGLAVYELAGSLVGIMEGMIVGVNETGGEVVLLLEMGLSVGNMEGVSLQW